MHPNFNECTTIDVLNHVRDNDAHIIDIRPIDCYNGWRFQGEMRGGHIRSSRSFPYKWFGYDNWQALIQSKEILPGKLLVLYGHESDSTEKAASYLTNAGYHVSLYNNFSLQWCSNPELPMSGMQRYHSLVPPRWLNSLITKGTAQDFYNNKFILCHTYYHDKKAYDDGHIPHAVALDTELFEVPETWNRRSPSELKHSLEQLGISFDTTVILYGRDVLSNKNEQYPGANAGHLSAMRIAFIMLYAGVKDVRILNGGMQSWIDERYGISREPFEHKPVLDFGIPIPQYPQFAVDLPEAREILESNDQDLVCVCSRPEYYGETSGYTYIEKKGHIPGSVFVESGSDAYHMENYRNRDQTTREYHEIKRLWTEHGLSPDKRTVFFCGTGWRAGEAFVNAWLVGWKNIAVFDGGWFEWSRKMS